MKSVLLTFVFAVMTHALVSAHEPNVLPKDVPPLVGMAITSNDSEGWEVQLTIPKVTWRSVGERRPKHEWPELHVNVEESVIKLKMDYPAATQLSDDSQNRVVDLTGRKLKREEAMARFKEKVPVLVSVSGQMPDPFYLQCTKPDTLIFLLGIPDSPIPQLLPREATAGG